MAMVGATLDARRSRRLDGATAGGATEVGCWLVVWEPVRAKFDNMLSAAAACSAAAVRLAWSTMSNPCEERILS